MCSDMSLLLDVQRKMVRTWKARRTMTAAISIKIIDSKRLPDRSAQRTYIMRWDFWCVRTTRTGEDSIDQEVLSRHLSVASGEP